MPTELTTTTELQDFVDHLSTFAAKVDLDGKFLLINKVAQQVAGLSEEDILTKANFLTGPWWSFDPTVADRVARNFRKVVAGEKIEYEEKVFLENKQTTIDLSMVPVKDPSGKVLYIIVEGRDTTILKTQEKKIEAAKTEFVTLASHQLLTPISAVLWFTEMLMTEEEGPLQPIQKEQLQQVYTSSQRMVALIHALLNVSRVELDSFPIRPETLNLTAVSHHVLEKVQNMHSTRKGQHIEEHYDPTIPLISMDSNIIHIVLKALFSNAIKYTPDGGRIKISIEKKDDTVLITVTDNGYGIVKDQQSQVFTKLFRASNVKERDTDGTGLDLYVTRAVLDIIGGKIWFTSQENKGSSFFVQLPLSGMKPKEGDKNLIL